MSGRDVNPSTRIKIPLQNELIAKYAVNESVNLQKLLYRIVTFADESEVKIKDTSSFRY